MVSKKSESTGTLCEGEISIMKTMTMLAIISAVGLIGAYIFRDKIKAILASKGVGSVPTIGTKQETVPGIGFGTNDTAMAAADYNECVKSKCNAPCYKNYNAVNCTNCQKHNCRSVAGAFNKASEMNYAGLAKVHGNRLR